jgi:hypothetical protein
MEKDSTQKTFYMPESTTEIKSCFELSGYYILENTYECIHSDSKPETGYFLANANTGLLASCHTDCKICTGKSDGTSTNCILCNNVNYYFLNGNCLSSCPEGYYPSTSDDIKVCKLCYEKCGACDKGEVYGDSINMNCIKCANNYYALRNDINNYDPENGNYLNCYNEESIMEGYFLNKSDILFVWEDCYERCATCTYKGNDDKMACLSCKTYYIENEFNKLVNLKLHKRNCIISCPPNYFLTYELDCVSSCLDGTFEYSPNFTCLNSCPDNFVVENNYCKFSSFSNETSISFFNEIIFSNISYFVNDSNKVLYFSDFKALVTPIKHLDQVKQIKNGISGLDFGDCIKILKKNIIFLKMKI